MHDPPRRLDLSSARRDWTAGISIALTPRNLAGRALAPVIPQVNSGLVQPAEARVFSARDLRSSKSRSDDPGLPAMAVAIEVLFMNGMVHSQIFKRPLVLHGCVKIMITTLVALQLIACGGGGGGGGDLATDVGSGAISLQPSASASSPVVAEPGEATGSIGLKWTAPVTRTDGTPISLADIDGYRIYYGKSSGNYSYRINITDGSSTSVTIRDLPLGVYYMAMTTYDRQGLESRYSSQISKQAL